MTPRLGLIWAQTPDGVIGADNGIPWRVPEDTVRFKELTWGHPVVMGRRTWDSLPARFRPLAGRRNIVITRRPDWSADGAEAADSLAAALARTGTDPVWVIGGGEIYRAAIDRATHLAVTEVRTEVGGDAYAPAIGPEWIATDGPWLESRTGLHYRYRDYLRTR